jgi:fibronectin type 3 domain-containing protein
MEDYAGFQVERSADSVNYTIVSQAPLISVASNSTGNNEIIYRDSLPENNRTYYYRARGITFFGSLSDPSNTISGKGRPAFREYPHIDSTTIIGNKYVRLKFGMPAAFDAKQLKGYVILRGTEKKGKYLAITQGLLSREADHYTDEKPEIAAYYKICAINAYGDSSFSFSSYARLADDVPPLPPQELKGAIDTSGAVILQWKANTEPDLLGYRVFRCNTEKEQPVELTKTLFKEPKFSDRIELKTLTKSIYYTVRAVDKTYNNSAYSTFCSLKRPDKIAPAEPVFKKAACSDSSIQVMWIPSSSIDVTHYKLLRKVNGQIWSLVKEWQAKDSLRMYTDTAIVIGNIYEYRLEISDETKNMSSATSQPVSYFPSFARPIKNFTAKPDFEKRIIHLTWTYPETQVYSYSIYKAKDNEDLRLFKTIDVRENSFTDRELYPGNKYHYFIKATLKNGIESKISEMVEVNF